MILGLSIYVAVFLFFGLSLYKAAEFARMPLHARMELYPVPSEKGRHTYGGSYLEEPEWWKRPRQISKTSELIDMAKEMLFIKKLFNNQKSLWWASYSFHLGIYFLFAWIILLIAGAITELAGVSVAAHTSWWTILVYYLSIFTGVIGFTITTLGAILLLIRRLASPILKKYTTPQEYFNLLLLLAALISGIVVWSPDLTFSSARQAALEALTLSVVPTAELVIHWILLEIMLVYIPISKMGHYVGKYFTYHKILWENEPNIPGSEIETKIKAALESSPSTTWSAPHMRPQSALKQES